MNTMKAAYITAPHHWEMREDPIPTPGEGEVLVRMMAAGVCGSDFHNYNGANPNAVYPRISGHENAGIVAQLGEGVTNLQVGDHVVLDLTHSCGECYQCRLGRKNVCRSVQVRGATIDGGWREYIALPAKEAYPISKSVRWEDAALVEPFAIGAHCTKRGRVTEGDVVFVLGAGTIGSVITQMCKIRGAATVICADVDPDNLTRSRRYGADFTIDCRTEDVVARVREITGGEGVTVAFDAACYPGSLTLCMTPGILRNAGRMVTLGFVTQPEALTQAMINQRELDIIGSRMSAFQFEPTIRRLEQGELITEDLANAFIPFREIGRVFRQMEHPDRAVKKMVITFFDGDK